MPEPGFPRLGLGAPEHTYMRDPTGHFPEEWAEVEALGVDGAAALMRDHAAAERPEKASRFRGVTKGKLVDHKGRKIKPWVANRRHRGRQRNIGIGTFAREEDAARAFDRVNIAKLGHAKAKTNFPVV